MQIYFNVFGIYATYIFDTLKYISIFFFFCMGSHHLRIKYIITADFYLFLASISDFHFSFNFIATTNGLKNTQNTIVSSSVYVFLYKWNPHVKSNLAQFEFIWSISQQGDLGVWFKGWQVNLGKGTWLCLHMTQWILFVPGLQGSCYWSWFRVNHTFCNSFLSNVY